MLRSIFGLIQNRAVLREKPIMLAPSGWRGSYKRNRAKTGTHEPLTRVQMDALLRRMR
jgi:hypothetical protein